MPPDRYTRERFLYISSDPYPPFEVSKLRFCSSYHTVNHVSSYWSDLSSVDFVIVRFLMKLFNTTKKLFNTTNQLSIIVDNILTLNCLVLSGLIVSEGLRKSSSNVTISFLQNFSLNSINYIYLLLVKFLFCLFFMFICYQLWWIKMYIFFSATWVITNSSEWNTVQRTEAVWLTAGRSA